MKNLLGLLVVGLVVGYAVTYKEEGGQSFLDKMNSEEGVVGNIKKAEDAVDIYGNSSQNRIEAEFGSDGY